MSFFIDSLGFNEERRPTALHCPICRELLIRDSSLFAVRWFCPHGHSFSSKGAPPAEILAADRQLLPPAIPRTVAPSRDAGSQSPVPAVDWTEAGDWDNGLVEDVLATQPWLREPPQQDEGRAAVS